jgi:sulfur-oxidizing protein SoxY
MAKPTMPATVAPRSASRRAALAAGAGLAAWIVVRPATAAPSELAAAIDIFAGGAPVRTGKVTLDVAALVDNGGTVPITVSVDSPMTTAEHVTAIAVFNERNPERDVARFKLSPHAGRAIVATRIRLATSQKLVAVAQLSDGTFWSRTVEVVVVLAACVEGDGR